jgi:preprotein translocase subunit SecF
MTTTTDAPLKSHDGIAARLYRGEVAYDFVSRQRRNRWYAISGVILLISLGSLLFRGLNYGIDFKGGTSYTISRNGHGTSTAVAVLKKDSLKDPVVQRLGEGRIRITGPTQTTDEVTRTSADLAKAYGINVKTVTSSTVGSTWGNQISKKALEGLLLFLVGVVIYISIRFEPKMAAAAFVALIHDLIVTAGVYSLVGFEVTPATVIAVLTILGFSLYDTVVVFDKVRDNTQNLQSGGRVSYPMAANLALNQTLMRSINTSIIALLPVASLLFVGAGLLGAGTLKDLALAQLVGLASGAYSSIFIATPMLVQLKEREPAMKVLTEKVARAAAAGKDVGTSRHAAVALGAAPGTVATPEELVRPATGGSVGGFTGRRVDRPGQARGAGNRPKPKGKRRR